MEKKHSKFLGLIASCLILFWGGSFEARAIPTTVVADIESKIHWMWEVTQDTAVKAAKYGAINQLAAEVNTMIGKGPGGPMYITNWRDALESQPRQVTQVQMKNLFTTMGKGRNGNYVAPDGSSSYAGNMLGVAEQSVMDMSIPQILNMAEYGVNDPRKVFNQRNMRAFMTAYGSTGGVGNSAEATLLAADMKAKYETMNQRLAEAQAIANGGYYSKMAGGEIVTPGSTLRDIVASTNNMSFTALATSQTIQEAIGGLVSRTVSNVVKKGIRSAKREVREQTGLNVDSAGRATYGLYSAYQKGQQSIVKGSF